MGTQAVHAPLQHLRQPPPHVPLLPRPAHGPAPCMEVTARQQPAPHHETHPGWQTLAGRHRRPLQSIAGLPRRRWLEARQRARCRTYPGTPSAPARGGPPGAAADAAAAMTTRALEARIALLRVTWLSPRGLDELWELQREQSQTIIGRPCTTKVLWRRCQKVDLAAPTPRAAVTLARQ